MMFKLLEKLSKLDWFKELDTEKKHEILMTVIVSRTLLIALVGFTALTSTCFVVTR
jgi:hypothetical protein